MLGQENVRYLKYIKTNRIVYSIQDTFPSVVEPIFAIATSNDESIKIGDEFEYLMTVDEVDEEGNLISLSSVKQAPPIVAIQQENAQLKARLQSTEDALIFLMDMQMGG